MGSVDISLVIFLSLGLELRSDYETRKINLGTGYAWQLRCYLGTKEDTHWCRTLLTLYSISTMMSCTSVCSSLDIFYLGRD